MLHGQENNCCYDGANVYSKVVTTYKVSTRGRLTINIFQVQNNIGDRRTISLVCRSLCGCLRVVGRKLREKEKKYKMRNLNKVSESSCP